MKTIKGDLVLTQNTAFGESIDVRGNITCKGGRFNLEVNGNIDARNISAGNISAGDISAGDISYYAFCVVYSSIKCTSIKGRRENSFHKALDGKITIKKREEAVKA